MSVPFSRTAKYLPHGVGATDNRYCRQLAFVVVVGGAVACLYLCHYAPASLSAEQMTLAVATILLGLLPSILYLVVPARPPIPFMPVVGGFYALAFGVPVFHVFRLPDIYTRMYFRLIVSAQWLTVGGIICMYVGRYLGTSLFWNTRRYKLPESANLSAIRIVLWVLIGVQMAARFAPSVLAPVDQFILPAAYMAWGTLFLLWLRKDISRTDRYIFLFAAPAEILARLATGSLAQTYQLAFVLIVLYWAERKRVPLGTVLILIVAFAAFNVIKIPYRSLTWRQGEYAGANYLDKSALFLQLAVQKAMDSPGEIYESDAYDSTITRISQITFLSYVMTQTPDVVPYWNGYSYLNLAYKCIPRLFWPGKPTENMGFEFSARYGMRSVGDTETSFNVPWIVELYGNFGSLGTLCGMFVVGMLLAYVERKFNRTGMTPLELAAGTAFLSGLAYQESNFSLMTGNILIAAFSLRVFFYLALPGIRFSHRLGRHAETPAAAQPVSIQQISRRATSDVRSRASSDKELD